MSIAWNENAEALEKLQPHLTPGSTRWHCTLFPQLVGE